MSDIAILVPKGGPRRMEMEVRQWAQTVARYINETYHDKCLAPSERAYRLQVIKIAAQGDADLLYDDIEGMMKTGERNGE